MRQVDFGLYLITDRLQCRSGDLVSSVEEALHGGVRAVQLREKDLSTRELFELGTKLRRLTFDFRARLFVNGDAALALAIGADGVHLPADGLPADACRRVIGPEMLIGVSTHNLAEARRAEQSGADFITYGPVYYTASKAKYGPPVGVESLRAACAATALPVFGLGGIKLENIEEVLSAGARGVAVISSILAAPDIESAASGLIKGLKQARSIQDVTRKKG